MFTLPVLFLLSLSLPLSFSSPPPSSSPIRYTLSEFVSDDSLFSGRRPFILTDAMKGWPAMNKWSIDYFSKEYGNEITDYYPQNMNVSGKHPFLLPLNEAIDKYLTPIPDPNNPSGPPLKFPSYIQFRFGAKVWKKLLPDISPLHPWFSNNFNWFEACLPGKKKIKGGKKRDPVTGKKVKDWPVDNVVKSQNILMVLIGREGSGMFFHWDNLHSGGWQANVQGRKRYVLCAPTKEITVKMDAFSSEFQSSELWSRHQCIDEIVEPGEILFWPSDWWHQTRCLDENFIGVTMRVWGPIQLHRSLVQEAFESECRRDKEDITDQYPGAAPPLSKRTCDNLYKCFQNNINFAPYLTENEIKQKKEIEKEKNSMEKEKNQKENDDKNNNNNDDDNNENEEKEEEKEGKNKKKKKSKKMKKSKRSKKDKKTKKIEEI